MASISTQATRLVAQHLIPRLHHANLVLEPLANQCTFSPSDPPSPYIVHSFMQTAMTYLCKYLALAATFTSVLAASSASQRIDTHIHALPPAYIKALEAAGGDPSGYPSPDWTLDATIKSMDLMQTGLGILSVSTPGVPVAGTGEVARTLARELNEYFGNTTTETKHNSRLGFFGVLPDWQDVEGTLAELDYLFQQQRLCNGVTVYTTYGDKLLGDAQFAPVWDRLQQYKALVFLHPGVLAVEPQFVASSLPQPIIDYPIATTRAAVDLVMSQTLRRCPGVDIILSHAGGTLPFLAERAIGSLAVPEIAKLLGYDMDRAREDFARFYYDTALSTSSAQLHSLLDFADSSHILFGSDFPYAPQFAINALLARYAAFVATDARGLELSPAKLRENSVKLLSKHALDKTV